MVMRWISNLAFVGEVDDREERWQVGSVVGVLLRNADSRSGRVSALDPRRRTVSAPFVGD